MTMNRHFKKTALLLLLAIGLPVGSSAVAQSKPRWVRQSEKTLDKARTNEGYRFKVFNTYGTDADRLHAERFKPLLDYVGERYGIAPESLGLDSLAAEPGVPVTYRILFPGEGEAVYVRKVDEYTAYEDYVDNTYQFEYYQLYAVTEKGRTPDTFDDFGLTQDYNRRAFALSLVPGLGQLYKGQPEKGYTIMGGEVALVAAIFVFESKRSDYADKIGQDPDHADSWRSKSKSWRQMRNIGIGLAGGLYIYNLIDAALSPASRRLIVRKAQERRVQVAPMASLDGAGLSFVLRF